MPNYLSPIDYVEKLSGDYSSLKDAYAQLKMKARQQSETIASLQSTVEKLKARIESKTVDVVSLNWNEIKNDRRITEHFKATKIARRKAKRLEKELKTISNKYYSLLAIMRQNESNNK